MADILMMTAIAGAENCAAVLSKQFQMQVETVSSRREGIALLRRHDYQLVIVDESMIEAGDGLEYDGDEPLLRHCGEALLLEVNFATSGSGRLLRAVRGALKRREQEKEKAARAAVSAVETEMREAVAGLLLHAQLAMSEPALPPQVRARLHVIAELATRLRERCGLSGKEHASTHGLAAQDWIEARPPAALRPHIHPAASALQRRKPMPPLPPLRPEHRRTAAALLRD